MNESPAELCLRRLDALKSLRRPHESVWKDCFDHTFPLRGSGFTSDITDAQQGQNLKARLMDSTATDAVRILASALMSGLTPANSRWFQLDIGTESEEEKRWLDDAAQLLWENIHKANFDAEAFEACVDVVVAGWFALYIEEDPDEGGLRFHQWPLASVYATTTDPSDGVDTVFRCYTLTAEQAVAEFGEQEEGSEGGKSYGVSAETARLAKKKPDDKVEFVHAIYPRKTGEEGAKLRKNMPIASMHIEVKGKHVARESGYHEMPVIVPRWMMIPESVYGVGPVFDVLPDVRMVNEYKRMVHAAADIAISGSWMAVDDGILNPRTVKLGARKIIPVNSVESIKPLQTGANFQLSEQLISELQGAIRKGLMADQLQPQDGPSMTATEVQVRVNMIRQLLGPLFGRFMAEYLQRLIERCFGLAYRANVFGPAPETMQGRDFMIRYISPLARAQKMEEVTAIERMYQNAGQIAAAKQNMEVFDVLDDEESMRLLGDALGTPNKVLRKSAEVVQIRKDRTKQQQAAQQQQQAMAMQQSASDAMMKKAAASR